MSLRCREPSLGRSRSGAHFPKCSHLCKKIKNKQKNKPTRSISMLLLILYLSAFGSHFIVTVGGLIKSQFLWQMTWYESEVSSICASGAEELLMCSHFCATESHRGQFLFATGRLKAHNSFKTFIFYQLCVFCLLFNILPSKQSMPFRQ